MWESPINITEIQDSFVSEIKEKTEEMVFTEIKRIGIDVEKEELIKALAYDRNQYEKGYADGYDKAEEQHRWIPCERELPKIPNSYLVTKMCENEGGTIYETAHEIFWTSDKKWDCERDEDCEWKVIAWQNKLAPYKPKGVNSLKLELERM